MIPSALRTISSDWATISSSRSRCLCQHLTLQRYFYWNDVDFFKVDLDEVKSSDIEGAFKGNGLSHQVLFIDPAQGFGPEPAY